MERLVDAMSDAYDEFVSAADGVVRTAENSGGRRTPETEVALQNFKDTWELLRASCDRTEEAVDSARRRISSENVVDAAAPPEAQAKDGGLRPVSVPSLERALESIRWLAKDRTPAAGIGGGDDDGGQ